MSLTFEQGDKILKILDFANASYPLTYSEMKRLRPLIYLCCVFGIVKGLSYQWYIHGAYNKDVNDFLLHLIEFTKNNPLDEWYNPPTKETNGVAE